MNDLMEMELNGFAATRPMAQRIATTRPRPRPLVAVSGAGRKFTGRPKMLRSPISPKAMAARTIINTQLARTLAPALSGVIAAAARRKFAVSHGEQIEMPDIARKLRDYRARLYMFLVSPAVMAAAKAFSDNPTTLTSSLMKGAVTFGVEKAKEAGLLNASEGEVVKKIAPKAIEKALPAIIEQLGKLGESEAEGDMLAELESRW